MKISILSVTMVLIGFFCTPVLSQTDKEQEPEGLGLPGDNLDLYAVLDLFQKSKTIEEFEKELNLEKNAINNLDLDLDNKVDFIKVVTKQKDDDFTFILQVAVSEKETQDVAVILVSKDEKKEITMQIVGDKDLYGKDYIIEPQDSPGVTANPGYKGDDPVTENVPATTTTVVVQSAPIVQYVYSPAYVPYYPPYYYGYYPPYFTAFAVMSFSIYASHHYYYYGYGHGGYHHTTVIHNTNNFNNYNSNRNNSNTVADNKARGNYKNTGTARPSTGASASTRPSTGASTRPSTGASTKPSSGASASTRPSTGTSTRPSSGTSASTRPSSSASTRPSTGASSSTRPSTSASTRPSSSSSMGASRTMHSGGSYSGASRGGGGYSGGAARSGGGGGRRR